MIKQTLIALLVLSPLTAPGAQEGNVDPHLVARRLAVLKSADLSVLKNELQNPHPLIRRAAVQALSTLGPPAHPLLFGVIEKDKDALARRSALRFLLDTPLAAQALRLALSDSHEIVRLTVVEYLAANAAQTAENIALLQTAQNDISSKVSRVAANALWPFHQEVSSAREKPEFKDHQLNTVQTIALPREGWKFQTDSGQNGHLHQWFESTFDDSQWPSIGIGKSWQSFGHQYEGVAWYRISFNLPQKPNLEAADLVFEAVDQSAWVWVNQQFVGQHDIGPEGWDKRFAADVTPLLKWGETNQIAVRVMKKEGNHAGIWKPVFIEALKK